MLNNLYLWKYAGENYNDDMLFFFFNHISYTSPALWGRGHVKGEGLYRT